MLISLLDGLRSMGWPWGRGAICSFTSTHTFSHLSSLGVGIGKSDQDERGKHIILNWVCNFSPLDNCRLSGRHWLIAEGILSGICQMALWWARGWDFYSFEGPLCSIQFFEVEELTPASLHSNLLSPSTNSILTGRPLVWNSSKSALLFTMGNSGRAFFMAVQPVQLHRATCLSWCFAGILNFLINF